MPCKFRFIDAIQDTSHQFAIDAKIELINQLDEEHPHLAFPHSSQIEGELRELRCQDAISDPLPTERPFRHPASHLCKKHKSSVRAGQSRRSGSMG
jgi:hypothetical protein